VIPLSSAKSSRYSNKIKDKNMNVSSLVLNFDPEFQNMEQDGDHYKIVFTEDRLAILAPSIIGVNKLSFSASNPEILKNKCQAIRAGMKAVAAIMKPAEYKIGWEEEALISWSNQNPDLIIKINDIAIEVL
jgi:hypothetical protein